MPNISLPNFAGKFLSRELSDYGCTQADVARLVGCTPSAIGKWCTNANSIKYHWAERVAFVFGVTVNDVVDDEQFVIPGASNFKRADLTDLSREIITSVDGGRINCTELALDAKKRALDHFAAVMQANPSEPAPLNPVLNPEKSPEEIARLQSGARAELQAAGRLVDPAEADPSKIVKSLLRICENARVKYDIQWVVKDDGTLGARRVTIEEF